MFEEPIVAFTPRSGFNLVGADIIVDEDEYEGVRIAAENLSHDFRRITGQSCSVVTAGCATQSKRKSCIIVGTLSKSTTIGKLEVSQTMDTSKIKGRWESWMTTYITSPLHGYDHALVIAGSDKRAAIFGIYSLSEQIGISP